MSKKKIYAISVSIFSLICVIANRVFSVLNIGMWFDIIVASILIIFWIAGLNYVFKKYKIAGYDDNENLSVNFYPTEEVADPVLKYAVIMSKYKNHWIFVRHEERTTWEIPGGRREEGENILKTAERELIEETGASKFNIVPISVYSVKRDSEKSYGLLCYAEIFELENHLYMEIVEVKEFDTLPNELTYPLIQPILFNKVLEYLEESDEVKSFT